MGEQQQAPGAKDLWVEGGPRREGLRRRMGLDPQRPTGNRGSQVILVNGPSGCRRAKAKVNHGAEMIGIDGVCVRPVAVTWEYLAEMPSPLAGWRKTPWPVGRGRAGTGSRVRVSSACGERKDDAGPQATRACLLPDHFYKSVMLSLLRNINEHLARWARRKYKRLHASPTQAFHYLARIARQEPGLFVHWQAGVRP